MLRFPNPSSDIGSFFRTFQALFNVFGRAQGFSLDDMSKAFTEQNLATSSGRVGTEALRRSTRSDRTRDPLFNQSKMYSELFRILGWIHPAQHNRQRFYITFLGAHVGSARYEPKRLITESLLGITFPNDLVETKTGGIIRPFTTLLKTIGGLEGELSRDEMIVGPLNIDNDKDLGLFTGMLQRLEELRRNGRVNSEIELLSEQLGIQVNTLHNYTRFPIGALRSAGLTDGVRQGRAMMEVLSETGVEELRRINQWTDVRSSDIEEFPQAEIDAFAQLSTFRMLERAGFSLGALPETIESIEERCATVLRNLKITDTRHILFSPFQQLPPETMAKAFSTISPIPLEGQVMPTLAVDTISQPTEVEAKTAVTHITLSTADAEHPKEEIDDEADIVVEIMTQWAASDDFEELVDTLFRRYGNTSQEEFYPVVGELFKLLDFDCAVSRVGVNYERMDALIRDDVRSIPIEIKSPNEEEYVSVKAIRQALENKIVLLARKSVQSTLETTSLVVGYRSPNERSDVTDLVDDIYKTFGFSIGIVDFQSLLRLACSRLLLDSKFDQEDLIGLRGTVVIHAIESQITKLPGEGVNFG